MHLKPPFDIAGDLDTPVSAFAKLSAFQPRFLLESVEGGERLARYSFIGFGEGLEVRLDSRALTIGSDTYPVPANRDELLARLRQALALAPRPQPELPGMPLAGGLVGYHGVRRRALLRAAATAPCAPARCADPALRGAAFAAGVRSPDARHRAAACGHRGRATGAAARRDRGAARRAAHGDGPRQFRRTRGVAGTRGLHCRRAPRAGIHCRGRRLPAGAVVAVQGEAHARSLPGLSRAAPDQSFALHVLLPHGRHHRWWARRPRRW